MEPGKASFQIQLSKDEYEKLINSKDSYSMKEKSYKLKPEIRQIFIKHIILADPKCKG